MKYFELPEIDLKFIKQNRYLFVFETGKIDNENQKSYIFFKPREIIKIYDYSAVKAALKKIDEYSDKFFVAGYIAYEAGYIFEKEKFEIGKRSKTPLIHICVFEKAVVFDHYSGKVLGPAKKLFTRKPQKSGAFKTSNLKLNIQETEYLQKINKIKGYIESGDTYQVNFTCKYKFDFQGDAYSFYKSLLEKQKVSYSAFCKMKDETVISLSPEIFFRRAGDVIISKPMKGTMKRGKTLEEDEAAEVELKKSLKNRAENIMIVDLIRNDLGRAARTGTVNVSRFFEIEKYSTLFQMTSTVKGKLKKDIKYSDILMDLFPGGSVTGAPKIRTMQIIKELEKEERGVYCGALGFITPKKNAVFNLPIRTIKVTKNKAEMGIGSGIVYDSVPEEEFKECMLKAKFLTEKFQPFFLLETLLWDKKYLFLREHLERMRTSSEYFDFCFDKRKTINELEKTAKNLPACQKYRIRLLSSKDGEIKTEIYPYRESGKRHELAVLSKIKTDPEDIFLYHKTTNRELYDAEYKKYSRKGFFDVVFLNSRKEVTEGAINNLFIQKNGKYFTPPVSSGLLPGVFRAYWIKKTKAKEKILKLTDLKKADGVYLCNSVHGLVEVKVTAR